MPLSKLRMFTEWITLNLVNGAYLLKDWLILNIGAGTSSMLVPDNVVDTAIKIGIGITIIRFNIVRIAKYLQDMKHKRSDRKAVDQEPEKKIKKNARKKS